MIVLGIVYVWYNCLNIYFEIVIKEIIKVFVLDWLIEVYKYVKCIIVLLWI